MQTNRRAFLGGVVGAVAAALLPWKAKAARPSPAAVHFGNLEAQWCDVSERSTVFQDLAGTIPADIDGPVGMVRCKLTGKPGIVAMSDSQRPTLRFDAYGRGWLEFDGVDDCMFDWPNIAPLRTSTRA